jgi:nucleotide-binding universal stress UspA family protein
MLSINTILHPTDFSGSARYAFEMACSLAQQHQAKLLLVHVVSPPAPPPLPYNQAGMGTIEEDAELAYERLEEMRLAKSQLQIEYVLAEGDPAMEIVRIARETNTDLIVIGTHGRTGLAHLLMGSVAEQVVREAPCRVITVSDRTMSTEFPTVTEETTAAPM